MKTEQELIDEGYVDGKKSFEFLCRNIGEQFDFERVCKTMKALDWVWSFGNERYGIPNVDTLKQTAIKLLREVYDNERGTVSTGGFTAGWDDGDLYLTFTIAEAHTG